MKNDKDILVPLVKGKTLIIQGPNGVGKTTLFNKIFSTALNQDIEMAYLFQIPLRPLEHLRCIDLFGMLYEQFNKDFDNKLLGPTESGDIGPRALEKLKIKSRLLTYLLNYFSFETHLLKEISVLSGGENQVLKLISALLKKSEFIILDEPTTHLDKINKMKLISLLKELLSLNIGLLISDHDQEFVDLFKEQSQVINLQEWRDKNLVNFLNLDIKLIRQINV